MMSIPLDEHVELRFAVSPPGEARGKQTMTYCIGGLFMTRHVIAQVRVGASESKGNLPAWRWCYRLRLR